MNLTKQIKRRKRYEVLFAIVGFLALMVGVLTFAALFADMAIKGIGRLDWDFFTSFPSRRAGSAGILSAWVGSTLVMIVTAFFAVPLGVAAGVYLEEYARKNWVTDLIEINITNLAGVPSIVYGLLALGLFVYQFGFGQSILSAGLTLALLILPVVIVATGDQFHHGIGYGMSPEDSLPIDTGGLAAARASMEEGIAFVVAEDDAGVGVVGVGHRPDVDRTGRTPLDERRGAGFVGDGGARKHARKLLLSSGTVHFGNTGRDGLLAARLGDQEMRRRAGSHLRRVRDRQHLHAAAETLADIGALTAARERDEAGVATEEDILLLEYVVAGDRVMV